ncbi:hypothetical protein [Myxococcus eversor]|uniref:hypothetical protein n=1 Tax=Myxococcus eversor TaxID=2709661 RepID=UPI0013D6D9DA|nr:hypothetical protein [Myxococcus eversor]
MAYGWRLSFGQDALFAVLVDGEEVVGDTIDIFTDSADGSHPTNDLTGVDVTGVATSYTISAESVTR